MRIKEITLYQYHELNDTAKAKARDWYRNVGLDHDWWDYEQFIDAATYLGIEIDAQQETSTGGYEHKDGQTTWNPNKKNTCTKTCIYFSGFGSQGDGACFYGTWRAEKMKTAEELQADFGTDKELHRIHAALWAFKERYPDATCTSSPSSSRYSHERSTNLEAVLGEEIDYSKATHQPLEECLVDFMQWIYRRLEEEWDYLHSDEAVVESIEANEYEFTEEGKRA